MTPSNPSSDSDRPIKPEPAIDQRPFFIVFNGGSGQGVAHDTVALIESVLATSHRQYKLFKVSQGTSLAATAEWAVEQARRENGIVVAAGGDGTLNAVCQALAGTNIPLGLVPLGTFNYSARNYGIPQDATLATRCLLDAHTEPVQAGFLNDRVFMVNASLGLYPQLLEDRETYKQNLGRSRLVAFVSALVTLMHAHRKLRIDLDVDGRPQRLTTTSMVVANNALQLEHIGVSQGEVLGSGRLVSIVVKPMGRLALYGLVLRGLLQRLGEAENLDSFVFGEMSVSRGRGRRIKVALDGEISWVQLPLQFKAVENAFTLLVPRDPQLRERS